MRIFLTKILVLGTLIAFGQQKMSTIEIQQVIDALGAPASPTSNNVIRTFNYRFEGVKGTPFISDDWAKATVITKDGDTISGVKLLYDVLNYELWIERKDGIRMIANSQQVHRFDLESPKGVRNFFPYKHPEGPEGKEEIIFLELIEEGNVDLYCKYRKYFVPADRVNAAYNRQRYDEYKVGKNLYYVQIGEEGAFEKIAPRKGQILKHLSDHKEEIKSYIKKNNYYVIDDNIMIDIIHFYNTL